MTILSKDGVPQTISHPSNPHPGTTVDFAPRNTCRAVRGEEYVPNRLSTPDIKGLPKAFYRYQSSSSSEGTTAVRARIPFRPSGKGLNRRQSLHVPPNEEALNSPAPLSALWYDSAWTTGPRKKLIKVSRNRFAKRPGKWEDEHVATNHEGIPRTLVGVASGRLADWLSAKLVVLYMWLALATPIMAASIPNPTVGNIAVSNKARHQSSLKTDNEVLMLMIGCLACVAVVIGARYWRRTWKLLAPMMGASSVAFATLRESDTVQSQSLSMLAFALWATATIAYVWTTKHLIPSSRYTAYILAISISTGMFTYMFAARLQERPLTALPPCGACAAYACKWFFQLHYTHVEDNRSQSPHLSDRKAVAPDDKV